MDDLEESDRFCMVERQPCWYEFAESNTAETQERSKINQWVEWRRVKKHTDTLTVLASRGGEGSRQELPRGREQQAKGEKGSRRVGKGDQVRLCESELTSQ